MTGDNRCDNPRRHMRRNFDLSFLLMLLVTIQEPRGPWAEGIRDANVKVPKTCANDMYACINDAARRYRCKV